MSDELSNATRIAALEADVVRLTAELQGERDDLDEISHSYGDALVEEAMLTRRIEELKDYNQRLLAENVRLTNEAAFMRGFINNEDVRSDFPNATAMRETLDSLRQSIYAACAGSGCLNAHELRAALDAARNELEQYRMRLAGALIASEGGDGQPSDALEYLRTCPTITSVMKLRQALDRERERCGVLEAEVKAWHAAEHLRKDEPHNEFMRLAEARFRTRETHALDAAKFVGGGQ